MRPPDSPPLQNVPSPLPSYARITNIAQSPWLTTLRDKLIKIGAKVTKHSKYVTFQLAEVAVTRNLFAAILDRIARLAIPPPVLVCGMPA